MCLYRGQCVSWICLEKTLVDAAEVASCVDHRVTAQNSPWMEGVWIILSGKFLLEQSSIKIKLGLASYRNKILKS